MQIEYFLDLLLSLIQWASSSQGNAQSPATILLRENRFTWSFQILVRFIYKYKKAFQTALHDRQAVYWVHIDYEKSGDYFQF